MYQTILIIFDLGYEGHLPYLIEPARCLLGTNRGKIHLLYINESCIHNGTFPLLNDDLKSEQQMIAEYRLKSLLSQFVPEQQQGECIVKYGYADEQILNTEQKIKPDFLIMASEKANVTSFSGTNLNKILGSISNSFIVINVP
ncbi:MAG: hypothetical protein CENE_00630 [Candidatus Celerinatantimonas neptuna]|nr:MAG: hypothetical protein CENE_00630 [Candidatus Celerinatantimonas neptuna]